MTSFRRRIVIRIFEQVLLKLWCAYNLGDHIQTLTTRIPILLKFQDKIIFWKCIWINIPVFGENTVACLLLHKTSSLHASNPLLYGPFTVASELFPGGNTLIVLLMVAGFCEVLIRVRTIYENASTQSWSTEIYYVSKEAKVKISSIFEILKIQLNYKYL